MLNIINVMKINNKILKEYFIRYNKLYFNGVLPTPKLTTYIGETAVGLCFFDHKNKYNSKISIARNIKWSEENLRNVLIHEMIHFYLGIKLGNCDSKHGTLFKNMCKSIYKEHNILITKTYPKLTFINKKQSDTFYSKCKRLFNKLFKF